MANKIDDAGDAVLGMIETVDDNEKAALDAVRRFVESVDQALPGGGTKSSPSRRVEIVEAALRMIEQLLEVSNDIAQRVTETVRDTLPELERNAKSAVQAVTDAAPIAKKAPVKKTVAKKAPVKKSPAKKTVAKKAPAKKAPAKKAPAKKAAAKKAPAKRS